MGNVRCKLEQAAPVWHNSLTKAESSSLERVQKTAVRLILKDRYKNYEDALKILKLDNLEKRRDKLTLNLAKSSLKIQKMNKLFPLNEKQHDMTKRNCEKFKVRKTKTERYLNSAVVSMQRMLNEEEKENVKVFKKLIPPSVLRTCDSIESISLRKFTHK